MSSSVLRPNRALSLHARRLVPLASAAALAILGVLVAPAAADEAGPGSPAQESLDKAWTSLWNNRLDDAILRFETLLDDKKARQSIDELSARRGLILAYLERGYERRAIDAVLDLERHKGSGTAEFLLARWIYDMTSTHGKDEKAFLELHEKLARRKGIDPLDRRFILSSVGSFALSNGDAKKAREIGRALNRIRAWSILGPFDNTSGSGHGRDDLDGRSELRFETRYVGKAGQQFGWHDPQVLDLLGNINFDNHFARAMAITAYAGTRIIVEEDATYALSLSRTGALRATLDETVLCDLTDEAAQDEYHHFEVDLAAGSHTLLLKVSSKETEPVVAASLTMLDGRPASGVRVLPLVSGSLVDGNPAFRARTPPLVMEIAGRVASNPTDAEATYWRLVTMILLDLEEDARDFAVAAEERFPDSAVMRRAIAGAYLVAEDADAFRRSMRAALESDPANAQAQLWEVGELIRRGQVTQSDSLLAVVLDRCPDFPRAEKTRLAALSSRHLVGELVEHAESYRARYPDYPDAYVILAAHYENLDKSKARRFRRQGLDRMSRGIELVTEYAQLAVKDEARALLDPLQQLYALFPDAPVIGTQVALVKLQQGDLGGLKISRGLAERFPYSYEAQWLRASIAEMMGPQDPSEKQEAIRHYELALDLNPSDFDTRDKLRSLQGKRPVSEMLPPIDLVEPRKRAPSAQDYPAADACVIADRRRRILFEDGTTFAERALLIKVFTDQGAQRFGSISTGVNPLFTDLTIRAARTLKADGSEVEAQRSWGGEVAFNSLAPGDLVELHYHHSSWSIGKLNQEYWDAHVFQWDVPCLQSSYEMLVPPGREFDWLLHNHTGSGVHQESALGDFVLHRWELTDIAPRHGEVHAPALRDVAIWLDVSTIPDWGRIVDWYAELSRDPARPDPRVARRVAEIAGPTGTSVGAQTRLARLYDFVANQVAYEDLSFRYSAFIPEPAPDVLRAMYGDCKDKACLLKAMLTEIGTESYFTLLSPVTDGIRSYLPSPRFTHAVLAVPTEDGYRFLDPTGAGTPAYRLSEAYWGAQALVIRPGTTELVEIPFESVGAPHFSAETDVEIDSGTDLLVRRWEAIRTADEVSGMRALYGTADHEKRMKILTTALGRTNVGVALASCEWDGLDPGSESVSLHYEMRVRDAVDRRSQLRLVKVPWRSRVGERFSMVVATEVRLEPLLLYGLQIDEDETLRLRLPPGWDVQGSPESKEMASPFGSFSVVYAERDGMLEARRRLRISGNRVPPFAYPEFRRFLEGVIREQDAVLVMVVGE